jgi:hypothetical protein
MLQLKQCRKTKIFGNARLQKMLNIYYQYLKYSQFHVKFQKKLPVYPYHVIHSLHISSRHAFSDSNYKI